MDRQDAACGEPACRRPLCRRASGRRAARLRPRPPGSRGLGRRQCLPHRRRAGRGAGSLRPGHRPSDARRRRQGGDEREGMRRHHGLRHGGPGQAARPADPGRDRRRDRPIAIAIALALFGGEAATGAMRPTDRRRRGPRAARTAVSIRSRCCASWAGARPPPWSARSWPRGCRRSRCCWTATPPAPPPPCCTKIDPDLIAHCQAAHVGTAKGHARLLAALGKRPLDGAGYRDEERGRRGHRPGSGQAGLRGALGISRRQGAN
jgi:hypothetical protein